MYIEKDDNLKTCIEIQNKFINIADSASFMALVFDENGEVIHFNKNWLDFAGKTIEQEKNGSRIKNIHPEDLNCYYNTFKNNFDQKREYLTEYRLKNSDNQYCWILEKGTPFYSEDGKFCGYWGACFDITLLRESEETVKTNEELYQNIVESIDEAVIITDINDRVIFANKRLCEMTNWSPEEIIGNFGYNFFINPKDWDKILEKNKLRYTGISDRYEMEILRKDKSSFWARILGSPYRNSKGEILGTIGVFIDITETKEAQKILEISEKKYRSVVEQVREVIFQTDAEGKITFINPFWTEITGYTSSETIGKNILDYVHKDDRKYYIDQFVNIIYQKKPFIRFSTRFKTKDGEYRWVEVNARMSYDDDNNILGTSGTVTDIHEIKLAEQELIIAKERAEESDKLKSNFLAQVSHEIRSPLNIILSYNYLIKEELHEKMKNDFDEAFEAINNSGKRLLRTIDLILNMSLIQTGKQRLNIKPVELNFVLKNLVNEFMPMAKKKNLSLNFNLADDEPKVLGDEYTLVQAFQNLIDNAIKYTNNGKIEILLNKMENKICVNIIDTGIGISESYIKNLFEPFSQEDNGYTRKFEGTGLGLALTKKYIELNSGILTVNSKKGEGSIFSVILNKA